MAKRRKKRTSIRTAAATAQRLYLERIRELRDDPLRVMPECPHGEPKPVMKVRTRLEKIKRGKPGFLDKRDRGIVGAVANILDVADQTAVPRLADHTVAGARRFYLQRGDVDRMCSIGVQNHDQPIALLMAWRPMAKKAGLHFFGEPGLWCTGDVPRPPAEWLDALAKGEGVAFEEEQAGHLGCGHGGKGRVVLGFRGGPSLAVCRSCARVTGNLHARVAARYAGPRQRQPVEVWFEAPDGTRTDWDTEVVAAYRAGAKGEKELLQEALERWRQEAVTGGPRYILGEHDFGTDQNAFLESLDPEPWERLALEVMTQDGHQGRRGTVEAVLQKHRDRLADGLAAILGPGRAEGWADRPASDFRDLLRQAHEEEERRRRTAALPTVPTAGPVGRLLDDAARARIVDGMRGVVQVAKTSKAPGWLRCAVVLAVGGDPNRDGGFSADDQEAAKPWESRLSAFWGLEGDEYAENWAALVAETGSGEATS